MAKIAFVTDSTADLTEVEVQEYGISVVPLQVIFGNQTYRDGLDLSGDEFYNKLRQSSTLPTTSQPSAGEFVTVFERLLKDYDTVLALVLSDKLSGTYRSALTAAQMVGGDVRVVDSKIATYGIGGPLLDGIQLAKQGASADEIVSYWEATRAAMKAWFIVDTLEYLHKGGRIGGAAAAFGTLLQIKPILTLVDGRIELFEKVRTHHRALERMLAELDAVASAGQPLRLGVIHSQREEDARALADQLVAKYPQLRARVVYLGAVIGTHTGPNVLSLILYPLDPRLG
ncbi:DegV family protein [Alicyclobacillaceae bacterium I2511]|jgi:DegV family protein with EDD domain|nr:DegV family protein [Alicyclobacillaceae bacterium I2511]